MGSVKDDDKAYRSRDAAALEHHLKSVVVTSTAIDNTAVSRGPRKLAGLASMMCSLSVISCDTMTSQRD